MKNNVIFVADFLEWRERSGNMSNPEIVAKEMKSIKENGKKLFEPNECLTRNQIAAFFSRLSMQQRKGANLEENIPEVFDEADVDPEFEGEDDESDWEDEDHLLLSDVLSALKSNGLLADEDHNNVNALIEEEATLLPFDSDAVSDSEWDEEDSLVLGKLKGKGKPPHSSVIKQRKDQAPQDDTFNTISDERKDDHDDDDDDDDLVPLSQFQEKASATFRDNTSISNSKDRSKTCSRSQEIQSSNSDLEDEDDISLADLRSKAQVFNNSSNLQHNDESESNHDGNKKNLQRMIQPKKLHFLRAVRVLARSVTVLRAPSVFTKFMEMADACLGQLLLL